MIIGAALIVLGGILIHKGGLFNSTAGLVLIFLVLLICGIFHG